MRSYIWVLILNPLEGEQLATVMDDLMLVSVANPVNFWLWSVKLLAGHTDAQRRAQAELDAAFGPPADAASPQRSLSADRTLLPFSLAIFWEVYEENNNTHMTIQRKHSYVSRIVQHLLLSYYTYSILTNIAQKQVLRYASGITVTFTRRATEDVHIREFCVPRDSLLQLHYTAINNDTRTFDRPQDFAPERFLFNGSVSEHRNPESMFLPFSTGKYSFNNFHLEHMLHF